MPDLGDTDDNDGPAWQATRDDAYATLDAAPPPSDDPYDFGTRLCDDDGIVRKGVMHHGTDYPCTGHAHYAGDHILCTSPAHTAKALTWGDLTFPVHVDNRIPPGTFLFVPHFPSAASAVTIDAVEWEPDTRPDWPGHALYGAAAL